MTDQLQPQSEAQAKMIVPRIMLEILIYGENKDKAKIHAMSESINKQILKSKNKAFARQLFYIDNGEKTVEQKKEWLTEHARCAFQVFAPDDYIVADNYVVNLLMGCKLFDRSIGLMKKAGITKGRPIKPENEKMENVEQTDEAPIEILE